MRRKKVGQDFSTMDSAGGAEAPKAPPPKSATGSAKQINPSYDDTEKMIKALNSQGTKIPLVHS